MASISIRLNFNRIIDLKKLNDKVSVSLERLKKKVKEANMPEETKKGLLQEIGAADAATTEIGSDLDALIALVSNPSPDGLTKEEAEEVRVALVALREKLTGAAAKYTA